MRILIYAPDLKHSSGGIYQYTEALLHVVSELSEHEFYFFGNVENPTLEQTINPFQNIHYIPLRETVDQTPRHYFNRVLEKIGTAFSVTFPSTRNLARVVKRYGIEVVHSTFDHVPLKLKVPVIHTIHDIQEAHFPEYFSDEQLESRRQSREVSRTQATKIICSYEHIRQDLIHQLGINEARVRVCLLSMKHLWINKVDPNDVSAMKTPEAYVLYPAATWEHKNHLTLVRAISTLKTKGVSIDVVCSGHQTPHYETIMTEARSLGVADHFSFEGIVSEQQLLYLYKNARAVVVPTKYEAGSFPLMESMTIGKPVVCSAVTSLPETIGESDFTFDPDNAEDMANKIELITQDESYRQRNVRNSELRAANFLETKAAEILQEVYHELQPQ